MREVEVSDDPRKVWLSPERLAGARGLLHWSQADLAKQSGVNLQTIRLFEDYGEMMGAVEIGAILAVLLPKVEFTTTEGEPGVVRKRHVGAQLGPGCLVFGGRIKRRPKL